MSSCDVFANDDEIACKAGGGKVIACFPDVCLSPPSPPAGPIPIPYPDTSFSKDMQNGSKTVLIKDKEVMLKDQSFYKTSPLGDEAATKGLGANVVTHVITGKTYFNAWSMDVQFEGQNVDRHLDLTTSNHASSPPGTPPGPNVGWASTAASQEKKNKCNCCGQSPKHVDTAPPSQAKAMSSDKYYTSDINGTPLPDTHPNVIEYKQLMKDIKNRKPGCTCNGRVVSKPPCNVYYKPIKQAEKAAIDRKWENNPAPGVPSGRKAAQARLGVPPEPVVAAAMGLPAGHPDVQKQRKIDHVTPRYAGGCPTGPNNLQAHGNPPGQPNGLCAVCQGFDDRFGELGKQNRTPSIIP